MNAWDAPDEGIARDVRFERCLVTFSRRTPRESEDRGGEKRRQTRLDNHGEGTSGKWENWRKREARKREDEGNACFVLSCLHERQRKAIKTHENICIYAYV